MPFGGIRDKERMLSDFLRKSRADLATIATNDDFVVALMTLSRKRVIKNLCIYEKKVYIILQLLGLCSVLPVFMATVSAQNNIVVRAQMDSAAIMMGDQTTVIRGFSG